VRITTDPASPKPGLGKRLWWFAGIYIVSVAVFAAAAFVLEALLPH
jgi:hypothetical protein